MIETFAWVLPRPNKSKYRGGFPLHFESKLLKLLSVSPTDKILHPFGGQAEFGVRVDINSETNPDYVGDAHDLSMFEDNTFDLVILDPPYNDKYSKDLYDTGKIRFSKYTSEAVRVCKPGGYVVMYHVYATPSIKGTKLEKRILMETRPWHKARVVHIHKKEQSGV